MIVSLEESECECGGVDEGDMKKDEMEDMKAENDEKNDNSYYIKMAQRAIASRPAHLRAAPRPGRRARQS
eukprot:COSAG06_NODE_1633_length_8855_cov_18.666971_4_plen_70_part_00